ncbi:hypothetical protein J0J29_23380, partial [Vibrio vulnificus]|uniref:hypothetical protein n=1 Tax=Vibrio vulnificus TaxID=672 RepID=UPI0019D42EBC
MSNPIKPHLATHLLLGIFLKALHLIRESFVSYFLTQKPLELSKSDNLLIAQIVENSYIQIPNNIEID